MFTFVYWFTRQYQKAKLKHSNAVVIRDSLRNEVSKQQISTEELREQMEQQVIFNEFSGTLRLNLIIAQGVVYNPRFVRRF